MPRAVNSVNCHGYNCTVNSLIDLTLRAVLKRKKKEKEKSLLRLISPKTHGKIIPYIRKEKDWKLS